ncbi:hypothetical protein PROFUN_08647 [Planoprotostelium fungivorum]|uniref:Uncharacterized protein n=1 Tax=Planoprotostelium fungivorum TaxID=1890364 RepID=A0A2P6NJ20_9EUKA|nr:hypothetical protein PROFUN_08647 [Planoprotostelium fungivorum]
MLYTVHVIVHTARGLPRVQTCGSLKMPSPLVCVTLDDQEIKTGSKSKTDTPKWSETIDVKALDGYKHSPLTVSVIDKRTLQVIGTVIFALPSICSGHIPPQFYELASFNSPTLIKQGQIQLEFKVETTSITQLMTKLHLNQSIRSEDINEILRNVSKMCSIHCAVGDRNRAQLIGTGGVRILLWTLENKKTEIRASYAIKNALLHELFLEEFLRHDGLKKLEKCLKSKSAVIIKNIIGSIYNAIKTKPSRMKPLIESDRQLLSLIVNLISPSLRSQLDSFHIRKSNSEISTKVFQQLTRLLTLLTNVSDQSQRILGEAGGITWLVQLLRTEKDQVLQCLTVDCLASLVHQNGDNQARLMEETKEGLLIHLLSTTTSAAVAESILNLLTLVIDHRDHDVVTDHFIGEIHRHQRLSVITNLLVESQFPQLRLPTLLFLNRLTRLGFSNIPANHSGHLIVTPLGRLLNEENDESVLSEIVKVVLNCCRGGVPIILCMGQLAQKFAPGSARSNSRVKLLASSNRIVDHSSTTDLGDDENDGEMMMNCVDNKDKRFIQRSLGVLPFSPFLQLIHLRNPKIARRALHILSILSLREASVDTRVEMASSLLIDCNFVEMLCCRLTSEDIKTLTFTTSILKNLANNEKSVQAFGTPQRLSTTRQLLDIIRTHPEDSSLFRNCCSILSHLIHDNDGGVGVLSAVLNQIPLPDQIVLFHTMEEKKKKMKQMIGVDEAAAVLTNLYLHRGQEASEMMRREGVFKFVTNFLLFRTEASTMSKNRMENLLQCMSEGMNSRGRVIFEVFSTEYFYLKFLRLAKRIYLEPLSRSNIAQRPEVEKMFVPFDPCVFIQIHTKLLLYWQQRLERWSDGTNICDVFVSMCEHFGVYREYCLNFERLPAILRDLNFKNESFRQFIKKQTQDHKLELTSLDLEAILIMPVQRPPRYSLLFKELLKHTPQGHSDYSNISLAIQRSQEIARGIDTNIQISKQEEVLHELEKRLNMNVFLPHRVFVREGILLQFSRGGTKGHKLHYFLFNDLLLLTNRQKTRKLTEIEVQYKMVEKLSLQEMEVMDDVEAAGLPMNCRPGVIRSRYTRHYFVVASPNNCPNEKEHLFSLLHGMLPSSRRSSVSSASSETPSQQQTISDWYREVRPCDISSDCGGSSYNGDLDFEE